jgi:RNA polymerase sigma-32 factor
MNALDRYRVSLNRVESLDAQTELVLATEWAQGNADAGRRLVEANLPFVMRIAREYRRWGVPFEDLVQQGNLGLLRAAAKYDPSRAFRLITYAAYWIRAEIRDYVVRGYRIVRLGTTRSERRAMRAFRRKGVDSPEALAAESGMPEARAHQLWPLLQAGDISLDAQVEDRSSAMERMASDLLDPEASCEQSSVRDALRDAVQSALLELSDRERRIVDARMLSEDPCTLEELGVQMGVSKERVRQLEARAKQKLAVKLADFRTAA